MSGAGRTDEALAAASDKLALDLAYGSDDAVRSKSDAVEALMYRSRMAVERDIREARTTVTVVSALLFSPLLVGGLIAMRRWSHRGVRRTAVSEDDTAEDQQTE